MKMNKKAFRISLLASLSRLIGVGLGASAGTLIHKLVGDGFQGWSLAIGMALVSFSLMIFAEYEIRKDL